MSSRNTASQVTVPLTSRVRRSIRQMSEEYYTGKNKEPLLKYLRAWYYITVTLPPTDPDSFFMLAGYHGEPFRGAGWGNPQWWGGYCNHGNVLFPTWHRAYLWRLENALRSAPDSSDVALAYWDETEDANFVDGLPKIFFQRKIDLEGKIGEVDNPLHSYKFQAAIWDNLSTPPMESGKFSNPNYSKPPGYSTCRFPFSGLQMQDKAQAAIDDYNTKLSALGESEIQDIFNIRLKTWLTSEPTGHRKAPYDVGLKDKYDRCLEAPNYTVFSNTTSATAWNEANFNVQAYGKNAGESLKAVVPLESPHNDGHLMVGGFNIPGQGDFNFNKRYAMANGDMGENDTAGFDPIFFHHHAWVDRQFWRWQIGSNSTKSFDIIPQYPGTNSVDNQGPTPGVSGNTWLTMDTTLDPFFRSLDNKTGPPMTSRDVIDIENQLGYAYEGLSPNLPMVEAPMPGPQASHHVRVSGVNKGDIGGSFAIGVYLEQQLIGYESFLSRWRTSGCANCQTHLQARAVIPLYGLTDEQAQGITTLVIPRLNAEAKTLVGNKDIPEAARDVVRVAAS